MVAHGWNGMKEYPWYTLQQEYIMGITEKDLEYKVEKRRTFHQSKRIIRIFIILLEYMVSVRMRQTARRTKDPRMKKTDVS